MRIISKSIDYYDCIQACAPGASDVTYVRNEKRYLLPHRDSTGDADIDSMLKRISGSPWPDVPSAYVKGVVYFCGKAYPFWTITCDVEAYVTCYSLEDVQKYFWVDPNIGQYKAYKEYLCGRQDAVSKRSWHHYLTPRSWARAQAVQWQPSCLKDDALFHVFKSPVIVFEKRSSGSTHVIADACLRNYDFQRMVDPYTAFQEISMFIGNNLAEGRDPADTVMTDVQRAESKGFDRWSFRKQGKKSKF